MTKISDIHVFEDKKKPIIPFKDFLKRQGLFLFYAFLFLVFSVFAGTIGYMRFAKLNAIDGFYNASMILTGMGPVNIMPDNAGKIFSSLYALYSGVAFLTTIGVMFAPLIHRLLHKMHVGEE